MIDLNTWNLSIPVGQPATTISTPALAGGYQDQYFKRINERLFFYVPISGTTTPNANYPRTELRETFPDGRLRNWTYPRGNHNMISGVVVTQVPSSGRIVIGQIHAYQQLTPLMKLEYRLHPTTGNGSIVAIVRLKPSGNNLVYTVTLSGPSPEPLTLPFTLGGGTATGTMVHVDTTLLEVERAGVMSFHGQVLGSDCVGCDEDRCMRPQAATTAMSRKRP